MIRNYLITAFRFLVKNKTTSIINVIGLATGIACCILIALFIDFETSFDDYHKNGDSIYRINVIEETSNGIEYNCETPFPLAVALRTQFGDDFIISRIYHNPNGKVVVNEQKYLETHILFIEPSLTEIFDFGWQKGSPENSLDKLNSVVLTETLANKYFPDTDAMGEYIMVPDIGSLLVTGIVKDAPKNTHLPYSMIINIDNLTKDFVGIDYDRWTITLGGFITYVMIPGSHSPVSVQDQFNDYIADYFIDWGDEFSARLVLQPLAQLHHDTRFNTFNYLTGKRSIRIFAIVGLAVLLIACLNYINLAVAQAIRRSREAGIRKIAGAHRKRLIQQFLGESVIMTLIATVIGIIIAEIFLPVLNQYLGNDIHLSIYQKPQLIIIIMLTSVILGILTGFYPAFVISGYKPLEALKNKLSTHKKSINLLKNGLVIFQFVISQVLIISTLVISVQMKYLQKKELGFNQQAIINITLPDVKQRKELKAELQKHSGIESVTFGIAGPQAILDERFESITYKRSEGREHAMECEMKAVDLDYYKTFNFELVAGRWMDNRYGPDSLLNVVINESMSKKLGFAEPLLALGEVLNFGRIIGVTMDFHLESLHESIKPMVMVHY
nr:ABC transporter permease [Bacteroidota bacterium]